eukprot:gb/GECH01007495.1/.p1 GENE.gb/GECH01007495.1/~~gb/GECH01007495.1/.p1  ORF type:complete len:233 (+),score=43.93 gb/GECH01007495.1/:1-699(+)
MKLFKSFLILIIITSLIISILSHRSIAKRTETDYYQVLGVESNASREEIRRAFKKKITQLHPDRNKSPDASERFMEVKEAFDTLSDPKKRRHYDMFGRNNHYYGNHEFKKKYRHKPFNNRHSDYGQKVHIEINDLDILKQLGDIEVLAVLLTLFTIMTTCCCCCCRGLQQFIQDFKNNRWHLWTIIAGFLIYDMAQEHSGIVSLLFSLLFQFVKVFMLYMIFYVMRFIPISN